MNVTIQWSKGKPPVMSIYDAADNTKVDSIELKDYDDKVRLNALMLEKGFRKMTQEELADKREEDRQRAERQRAISIERTKKIKEPPDIKVLPETDQNDENKNQEEGKQPDVPQGDEL
jgi:hypothetical protein